MTTQSTQVLSASNGASATPPPGVELSTEATWSNLWQVPTIAVSAILIFTGVQYARRSFPEHDFAGAFSQIEKWIDEGKYDAAAEALEQSIAPHLAEASERDRGRFYADAADLLYRSMEDENSQSAPNLGLVAERYDKARNAGFSLSADQVERWVTTLLLQDEFDNARSTLKLLDPMLRKPETADRAGQIKGHLLRRMVEASLDQGSLDLETGIELVEDYRGTVAVTVSDQVWAIARMAELRLGAGLVREAVEHLHLEMRLIEPQVDGDATALGEAYVMLARAYYELGELNYAEEQARTALDLISPLDPARGGAHVTRGLIRASRAQFEEALDEFSTVVEEFPGSRAYAAALLGRAEMNGVLGDHVASQRDFESLAQHLISRRATDVTPQRAAQSLCDRHDAALASRQFDLALAYIDAVGKFIDPGDFPEPVLRRLASTHQVIADKLRLVGAGVSDPSAREQSSRHGRLAAGYHLARAAALQASPTEDAAWADSLWNAADSFDLAGYHQEAAEQFEAYLANRTPEDDRWADAKYRLARCRQALGNFADAAVLYEEVIEFNPNSLMAAASHVPLAECLLEMDNHDLAEQRLLRVTSGGEPVGPQAVAFRDAIITLGTFYYNQANYLRAIEELEKASRYCEDDPRINFVRFRLADSYRLSVMEVEEVASAAVAPGSSEDLLERHARLMRAMSLFSMVADSLDRVDPARLDAIERDCLRNAHLYRADCAFEIGDYAQAIEMYDRAAQRFADHPSSITALIQIVNSYARMGDRPRALAAHNRVLLRLQQIPEGTLGGPEGLMDEEAWKRWLDALPPGIGLTGANASQ